MTDTEARFHQAMIDLYVAGKRDCRYNATYFLNMVSEYGGLATAQRLLATDAPAEGFTTLYLCGRLDLTVEAHVIRPEFRELFTPQELERASERLRAYGYSCDR